VKLHRRLFNHLSFSRRPSNASAVRHRRPRFDLLEDRRMLAAADLDTSFDFDGQAKTDFGLVHSGTDYGLAVAYQSDGKIVVLGQTDNSGATIVRYNDDGSMDTTFGAAGRLTVDVFAASFRGTSLAVDSSDRIVIAGNFNLNGEVDFGVLRLNSDGSFDTTFDGDGKQTIDFDGTGDYATSVELDGIGRIVVAGYLNVAGSAEHLGDDFALVRLNSDGSIDTTFGSGGRQTVDFGSELAVEFGDERATSVTVDGDQRIIVAGDSLQGYGGTWGLDYDFAVARLNSDGSLDMSFGAGGKQLVDITATAPGEYSTLGGVAVDSAGRIILAGTGSIGDAGGGFAIARLTGDGALDSTFSGDGKQLVDPNPIAWNVSEFAYLALDSGDRIVVAGGAYTGNGHHSHFTTIRVDSEGSLDTTFSDDGIQVINFDGFSSKANAVTVDTADRILIIGVSGADFAMARLTKSGTLDTTFSSDGKLLTDIVQSNDEFVTDIEYQADGKVLVLGQSNYGSTAIARYTTDGSLDASFGTAGTLIIESDVFYSMAVDSLNRIVLAGNTLIARLNADGSPDMSFGTEGRQSVGMFVTDSGAGLVVDNLGRIIMSGYSHGPGQRDFAVIRLDSDGWLDTTFGDGRQTVDFNSGDDYGNSVAVDSIGRILISGVTYQAATGADFAVARLNADGSLDTTFGVDGKQIFDFGNTEDTVRQVIVDDTDRIVVVGDTNQTTTGADFAVVRLTDDGQLDATFGAGGALTIDFGSPSDHANGLAVDEAGRIVVVGATTSEVTKDDIAVVRLNDDGTLDTGFGEDGKQTVDSDQSWETGVGVIVDNSGRIVIAGHAWSWSTGFDFALVRLIGGSPSGDVDGDGIEDSVDPSPNVFSNDFSDVGLSGGATSGTITSRGDQVLTIVDASSAVEGVLITASASGGANPALITVENVTHSLDAGESIVVTHGSVITRVIAGPVLATYADDNSQVIATANIPAEAELTFKPETLSFAVPSGNAQILVDVVLIGDAGQEATATLTSGNQISFDPEAFTFTAPPTNNSPVEVIAAGAPLSVVPGTELQPVSIDIRPGDSQNTLNLGSNGVIAVAILSTSSFNALQVMASSVVFAGAHATKSTVQDVDGDGRQDLVLSFRTQDTTLQALYASLLADDINGDGILDSSHQTASVSLSGQTVDEVLVQGFDDMDLFLAGKALRTLLDQLAAAGAL
jgi:uncharacterized delta-60 repeat protein